MGGKIGCGRDDDRKYGDAIIICALRKRQANAGENRLNNFAYFLMKGESWRGFLNWFG